MRGFWSFEFHLGKGCWRDPSGRGGTRPSTRPCLPPARCWWELLWFWRGEYHLAHCIAGNAAGRGGTRPSIRSCLPPVRCGGTAAVLEGRVPSRPLYRRQLRWPRWNSALHKAVPAVSSVWRGLLWFWRGEYHLAHFIAGNAAGRGGTRPSMTPALLGTSATGTADPGLPARCARVPVRSSADCSH